VAFRRSFPRPPSQTRPPPRCALNCRPPLHTSRLSWSRRRHCHAEKGQGRSGCVWSSAGSSRLQTFGCLSLARSSPPLACFQTIELSRKLQVGRSARGYSKCSKIIMNLMNLMLASFRGGANGMDRVAPGQ